MSAAERMILRKYRERIKNDSVRHEESLKKDKERWRKPIRKCNSDMSQREKACRGDR